MVGLNTTTIDKRREQQRAAQERARQRQRQRMADPAWQAGQREKQQEAHARQLARQRDPEVIAARRARQAKRLAEKAARDTNKPAPAKRAKSTSTRGLKGRTPTAAERRYMDAIGQLPCICCHLSGRHNPVISLHHIDGRTKPDAHKRQLPLCQWHHDVPAEPEQRAIYPDLIPIHAKGAFGGKAAWETYFGSQDEVLSRVYALAGL